MKNQILCELCEEDSKFLCVTCNSYYCEDCFNFVHKKKKNLVHKKEEIDPYVPIETKCSKHQNSPINLFYLNEKVLCCYGCQMEIEKSQNNNKFILLNDEASLKKENITVDSASNNFDEHNGKINELKKKIENEITKTNKVYDKIKNEIVIFYEEKQKNLKEEENKLKENLDNEVTKVKEQLENFFSQCDQIIKLNERIRKGLEKMKKDKENNMRKILSYVSKMNKNQKDTNDLLSQSMSNLNLNFDKENCDIKFEKYNFNDSIILEKLSSILNKDDASLIISWLPQKPLEFKLLFDTKRDGDYSSTFHDKCDGKSPTLVVIKSSIGYIFGGYVTAAWNSNNNNAINAPNSFLFSLNQKQKYYDSQNNPIIYGGLRDNQNGSIMLRIGCCDLQIKHNCTAHSQNSTNCDRFSVPSKNILNGGNQYFTISNLEVYEIKYR